MIYLIDLFCGAGGLTEGASRVPGVEVKKFIGNAVEVTQAWALFAAIAGANFPNQLKLTKVA